MKAVRGTRVLAIAAVCCLLVPAWATAYSLSAAGDSTRGKKDEVVKERVPGKEDGGKSGSYNVADDNNGEGSFVGDCIGEMMFSCCSEVAGTILTAMFAPATVDAAVASAGADSLVYNPSDSLYEAPLRTSVLFTDYLNADTYITAGFGIRVPSVTVKEDYKNPLFGFSLGNDWYVKGAHLGILGTYAFGSGTPSANFQTTIKHPDNTVTYIVDAPERPALKQFTLQFLAGYAFRLFMVDYYKALYCNFGASAAYTYLSEKTEVRSTTTPPAGPVTTRVFGVEQSVSKVAPGAFLRVILAGGYSVGILSVNYDYIGTKGNKKLSTPMDFTDYRSNLTIGLSLGISIR